MSEKERCRVGEDGRVYWEGQATEKKECSDCEKKSTACISFFAHENAMMHKDVDNERMHETMKAIQEKNTRTTFHICMAFIVIILLFVVSYTVRTEIWNETVREMNAAIVELANAKGVGTP